MSSKSRKNTNKITSQPQQVLANENKPRSSGESVHVAGLDIPDEVIHVPKGATSPLRFILMILLVVVLLVIFVVPTAFQNLGSGATDAPVFFSWNRPGVGVERFNEREVALQAQAMQNALQLDVFSSSQLGVDPRDMSTASMARLLVLDQLAVDAGIRVPEVDLGKHLLGIPEQLSLFGQWPKGDEGVQRLREYLRSYPQTEPNVRRMMRIKRLIDMTAFAAGQASPKGIVEQWEREHTELAFDYVALASADFDAAARAELPSDEELEAWLGEQAQFERDKLSSPERRRIELVSYREGSDYTKLMEAYPLEEGLDLEELAKTYHAVHGGRRFPDPDPDANLPLPFENEAVRAACLAEAPVNNAMQRWLKDLKPTVENGADPNLLVLSNPLGLSYLKTELLSRDEMAEKPEFEDPSFLANAFFTPAGAFAFSVSVGANGPVICRVAEKAERELPPFAEIKDKVADLWVLERVPILGRESLEAIRDGFEVFVPEEDEAGFTPPDAPVRRSTDGESFAAAVSEAGYSLGRRDWLDIGGSVHSDPLAEDEDHKFLNISNNLKRLEENEVVVEFDSIKKRLYLVRCSGRRAVDLALMSPKDFKQYRERDANSISSKLAASLDQEFLFENFDFRFSEDSGVPNPGDENFGEDI